MKKFLVTLLVAMLALCSVAFAQDYLDDATNHVSCPESVDFKAPTCQATGYCVHKVGDNWETYTLKMIPHGEDKGVVTVEPTCTEKGVMTYTCQNVIDSKGTICGHVWTAKITQTTHTPDWFWLVKPTCTTAGVKAYGCSVCGYVDSTKPVYTWWKNGSGVNADGYTYRDDCAPQNKSHDPQYHTDLSGWLTVSEQTCVDPLLKENLCRACGLTLREYKPAAGHNFTNAKTKTMVLSAPNCKEYAIYVDYQKCNKCDYYVGVKSTLSSSWAATSVGDKVGLAVVDASLSSHPIHDQFWAVRNSVMNSKANVKNTGAYYIENHDYLYVVYVGDNEFEKGHHVMDAATAHIKSDNTSDMECYDEGNDDPKNTAKYGLFAKVTEYKCAVCKQYIPEFDVYEYPAAPAHDYTAWKEVVAPTEDTNFIGKWTRYCLNEGCTKFESYIGGVCGKENHLEDAPVLENVVEATYTADGSAEEVIYCAVCGEELSRKDVVLPMLEGINPEDNTLYEDGKASTATGIVTFGGKDYYLINGKKTESMGATLVGEQWYWMAHGIVQAQATGAQLYDGEWFYVKGGKIDITKSGLIEHDGEKFWVAAGRLTTEYTGLVQNGSEWIMISAGRFAPEYSGVVTYDGAQFNVVNGIVK